MKKTKKYILNADEHSNSKTHTRKNQGLISNLFLIFHVVLSAWIIALMFSLVKKLSYISPGQIAFARNFGIFAGALPTAIYCTEDTFGEKKARLLLVLRGVLGGICFYLESLSFTNLPVVEAAIILSSQPAVTSVAARIALKESCGLIQSLILTTAICGVLLAVDAPRLFTDKSELRLNNAYIIGLLAGIGNILLRPIIYIAHRKVKHIHFSTVMLYFGFISMLMSAGVTLTTSTVTEIRCGLDEVLFGLLAVLGFLANMSITVLMQKMDAGLVTAFRTLEIVTAMVFQIIFFHKIPDLLNICGGCLVMLSVIALGVRNWTLNLPQGSIFKKIFKYLII